jgi:hypothetical protein
VTSANRIADATEKGVICINISVSITSITALIGENHGNSDIGAGTTLSVIGAVQSQVAKAVCAGSQAWIQTYAQDGHRSSDATTLYVIFH